jgi:hypothetical protein
LQGLISPVIIRSGFYAEKPTFLRTPTGVGTWAPEANRGAMLVFCENKEN